MPTANITITSRLDEWISDKVRSGEYDNASEVFREALRLLKSRDERDQLELRLLQQKVVTGLGQAERGEFSQRNIRQIIADGKERV